MIKRIIACLDVFKDNVVKGIKFKKIKIIGNIYKFINKYKTADEIVYLNINKEKIKNISFIIKNIFCKIPLIIGGNIKNLKDVNILFKSGADKISLNSTLYYNPNLIKKICKIYGKQSIICSIDVKKKNLDWFVYINGGKKNTKISILDWIKIHLKYAGEFLITSINRDGTNKGYDICLINFLLKNFKINIIASGGGGGVNTIKKCLRYCNAALLASILHKNKLTIFKIKKNLEKFFYIR
ncbi:HisA/HisF-related TIM barrel protein [Candidatus Vidania fulgoroideorum]